MVFFEKALFVFKFEMKMLPDQFSNYLTEASHVYEKFTRASYQNNYFIPLLNTSKAQRSIKISRSSDLERIGCRFKNM